MIIPNGHIECKLKTGGGIDLVTRYPAIPEVSWGEPIPCQYIPARHDFSAVSQGEHYTLASYTILIEERPFTAERIRLTDHRSGRVIGEYSVRQTEYLDAVCQVRITV